MSESPESKLASQLASHSAVCIALFGKNRAFKDLNELVVDHIDSLVVEAIEKSPLISLLPHKKLAGFLERTKLNVVSFDRGLASAEAGSASTEKQINKRYTVRHGLALEMEKGFHAVQEGVDNFHSQLRQLVDSIQAAMELEVLEALVGVPGIERRDLFGIFKKSPADALNILISEARRSMRCPPTFLLCHSKLAPAGEYRGIKIVHCDDELLRRKTSVAEYYRVPPQKDRNWELELYDESRGTWFRLTPDELDSAAGDPVPPLSLVGSNAEYVIIRPAIEHSMLSVVVGGECVGSTLWGQTEASCYESTKHGLCGMSYKYHSKAVVFDSRKMARFSDVAYDGYIGGKDDCMGPSLVVMKFYVASKSYWPSPIVFYDTLEESSDPLRVFNRPEYSAQYKAYLDRMSPPAESFGPAHAYQGSMRLHRKDESFFEIEGSGHHDF